MLTSASIRANHARRRAAETPWEVERRVWPLRPHINYDTTWTVNRRPDESSRRISTATATFAPLQPSRDSLLDLAFLDSFRPADPHPLETSADPNALLDYSEYLSESVTADWGTASTSIRTLLSPGEAASIPTITLTESNEDPPRPPPQAMEGSGVRMLAPTMPRSPFDNGLNFGANPSADVEILPDAKPDISMNELNMDFAPQTRLASPFEASNVRGNVENMGSEQPAIATQPEANIEANSDDIMLGPMDLSSYAPDANVNYYNTDAASADPVDLVNANETFWADTQPLPPPSEPEKPDPANMRGYAQLQFNDGRYLVTSTELVIGRNDKYAKSWKKEQKRKQRLEKESANRSRAAEEALNQYRQEPSQHEGDPSSKDDQSLEGRPAKGLASAFSEQGGIIEIKDGDDEARRKRKDRKRKALFMSGQSSSTTSVVPANLHTFASMDAEPDNIDDAETSTFLPVYPPEPNDIFKISRAHLRLFYNKALKMWQLEVLGMAAFAALPSERPQDDDDDSLAAGTSQLRRGEVINLESGTRIQVASLAFVFKLPRADPASAYDSDSELSKDENALASPARRLSNAMSGVSSDEEDGVPLAQIAKQKKAKKEKKEKTESSKKAGKKPAAPLKIKLKPAKPPTEDPPAKEPAVEPAKPVEAGKKPKKTVAEPETNTENPEDVVQTIEGEHGPLEPALPGTESAPPTAPTAVTAATPSAPVTQIEPDSALAEIDPGQLPEKRKGPGRPPKNGLVSKRDMGMIRRIQKDLEKNGQPWPPFDQLVARVRAENKQKEAAAKAAARGEPPPPPLAYGMGMAGPSQMPQGFESSDAALISALTGVSGPPIDPAIAGSSEQPRPVTAGGEPKESPKRQRAYRSPSPMKPMSECTEEELRKPTHTYYTTIDMILSEGPPEGLELQQIYDKICKKFPYYKYGGDGNGNGTGWQSSVRHNLKQHDRFRATTKQGKGWLWTIDQSVPFDKEKKRQRTPPPTNRTQVPYQMQNGVSAPPQQGMVGPYAGVPYPPGQYGQPVNGQPPFHQQAPQSGNPQTQYSSPYGQPGQAQTYGPPQPHSGAPANVQYSYQQQQFPAGGQTQYAPATFQQPSGQPRASHTPHPHPGPSTTPRPSSSTPQPPKLKSLVDRIMSYRSAFLAPYARDQTSTAYKYHEAVFKKCVDWISELQSNGQPSLNFICDLERKVYQDLEGMMRGDEGDGASAEAGAAQHGQDQQALGQGQGAGSAQAGAIGPPPVPVQAQPQAQAQAQVQQGQAAGAAQGGAIAQPLVPGQALQGAPQPPQQPQSVAGQGQPQQTTPQGQQQMPPHVQRSPAQQQHQPPPQGQQQVPPQAQRSPGQQSQQSLQMPSQPLQMQQPMQQQSMQPRSPHVQQNQGQASVYTNANQLQHQLQAQPSYSTQQNGIQSPGQQIPTQAQQAQQSFPRQQSQGHSPNSQQQYGQMQHVSPQMQSMPPNQAQYQATQMQRSNSWNQAQARQMSPMPTLNAQTNLNAQQGPPTPSQGYGVPSRPTSAQGAMHPHRSPSFAAPNGSHTPSRMNPISPMRSPNHQYVQAPPHSPYGQSYHATASAPMSRTPSGGHPAGASGTLYQQQHPQYHQTPSPRPAVSPAMRPSVSPARRPVPIPRASVSPAQRPVPIPRASVSQSPRQPPASSRNGQPAETPTPSRAAGTTSTVPASTPVVAGSKRAAPGEEEGQGSPEKKARTDK